MPVCERCGKSEAEWRCQVCGRVVCVDCARPTEEGVFCVDHVPAKYAGVKEGAKAEAPPVPKKEKGRSKALQRLFLMLLFLTFGLALLIFVGDWLLGTVLGGITGETGFAEALRTSGWMLVYGMGGLTLLIGLAWLASGRKRK